MTNREITRRTSIATSTERRHPWSTSARRMGRDFVYAVLGLPLGVAAFAWQVSELAVGASLIVTVIGLPLLVLGGTAARWFGSGLRVVSNAMTGDEVPTPPSFRPRPGALGWIRSGVTDGVAWRARLYLLLKLPLGVATSVTAVVMYATGVTALTYWMWRPLTGCDASGGSACHRGGSYVARHHLDSATNLAILAFVGLVILAVTPRTVRGLIALDRMAVRALLGPRP